MNINSTNTEYRSTWHSIGPINPPEDKIPQSPWSLAATHTIAAPVVSPDGMNANMVCVVAIWYRYLNK